MLKAPLSTYDAAFYRISALRFGKIMLARLFTALTLFSSRALILNKNQTSDKTSVVTFVERIFTKQPARLRAGCFVYGVVFIQQH